MPKKRREGNLLIFIFRKLLLN